MGKRGLVRIVVVLGLCLVGVGLQAANGKRAFASTAPAQIAPVSLEDLADLEDFLDGFFKGTLEANHIPGAVISIVKDGALYFSKGYGYADLARGVPVDPARHLFRVGSVSKLFVWTSAMQLAQRGLLNLNADIRPVIDVRLPRSCSQPITMGNLMAHTPGFEDQLMGLFALRLGDLVTLEDYLRQNPPECIFEPGQAPAYSNYGAALAGYMIERIMGMPFDAYVEEEIFQPLEMNRSTFRQPVSGDLVNDLAVGYAFVDGAFTPGGFEYVSGYPSGSLSTTALDMANFMIAHLQEGRFKDVRILSETTARLMHTQHYTYDPRSRGLAHGFLEMETNGYRMLSHGGDTFLFHSLLVLIPDQNLGLFVSFNAPGGVSARDALLQAFMDRYFPAAGLPQPSPLPDSQSRLEKIAGEYYGSRRNESTIEKLFVLMQSATIRVSPEGFLILTIPNVEQTQWVEIEPYVFRNRYSHDHLYFEVDENGTINSLVIEKYPWMVAFKTPWYATVGFSGFLLLAVVLSGITVFTFWPVLYIAGQSHAKTHPAAVRYPSRLARWTAFVFYFLVFIFLVGFGLGIGQVDPTFQVPEVFFGPPDWFMALLWLPWVMVAVALGMVVFLLLAWTGGGDSLERPYWGLGGRLHYTLVVLAGIGWVWFCYYWNLF